MATIEQSLYNIATALEIIAEELKTMNDSKPEPVTAAISEILKDGHPDWIVVPRDYIERLAKEHNIDVRKLYIAPLKTIFGDEEDI